MICSGRASTQPCSRWRRPEAVTANGLRKTILKVFLSSTKSQTSLYLIYLAMFDPQVKGEDQRPSESLQQTQQMASKRPASRCSQFNKKSNEFTFNYCNDWLYTDLNPTLHPTETRGRLKLCSSHSKWPQKGQPQVSPQFNKKSNEFTFNYLLQLLAPYGPQPNKMSQKLV